MTDSSRSSNSAWTSIYNAHIFRYTLDLFLRNGIYLQESERQSFLHPIASVINPVSGMNMNEDTILEYLYQLPKMLHWTARDVLDMDPYWCKKTYDKLAKDIQEENKRREEEAAKQEAEQQAREQEMRQQYSSMQNHYSGPNYNDYND